MEPTDQAEQSEESDDSEGAPPTNTVLEVHDVYEGNTSQEA